MKQETKNIFKYLFHSLMIALCVCSIFIMSVVIIYKLGSPIEVSFNGLDVKKDDISITGNLRDFIIVSKRFADNNEYNIEEYNCVNYTNDMKSISEMLGFDVSIIRGCKNKYNQTKETCHAWLQINVDFEPQTGNIVDYSKTYPYDRKIIG